MIISKEDKLFVVKIFKEYLPKDFDIFDQSCIRNMLKKVLIKLKKKYQLSGLLDIDVYINSDYGMIIEVDNICLFSEEIDANIQIHLDCIFMNEIGMAEVDKYKQVYYYDGQFYGVYQGLCDSHVIYKDCDDLMEKGIKVY